MNLKGTVLVRRMTRLLGAAVAATAGVVAIGQALARHLAYQTPLRTQPGQTGQVIPASPQVYNVRVTVSAAGPAGNLALLRRNQGQRPWEALIGVGHQHGLAVVNICGKVRHAIDGSVATLWETETYTDDFAAQKSGVGLILNPRAPVAARALDIVTPLPGWTAEVYASNDRPDEFQTFGPPSSLIFRVNLGF